MQSFGLPINIIKAYLNTNPSERSQYYTGIPLDPNDNQLGLWLRFTHLECSNLSIKVNIAKGSPGVVVKKVESMVQEAERPLGSVEEVKVSEH